MKYKVGDKEGSEVIDKDCYSYIFVCDNCGEGTEVSTWNEVLEFMREVRENAARGKGGG